MGSKKYTYEKSIKQIEEIDKGFIINPKNLNFVYIILGIVILWFSDNLKDAFMSLPFFVLSIHFGLLSVYKNIVLAIKFESNRIIKETKKKK